MPTFPPHSPGKEVGHNIDRLRNSTKKEDVQEKGMLIAGILSQNLKSMY